MRVARGGRKSKKNNFSSSLGLTIARDSHFAFASCLPMFDLKPKKNYAGSASEDPVGIVLQKYTDILWYFFLLYFYQMS